MFHGFLFLLFFLLPPESALSKRRSLARSIEAQTGAKVDIARDGVDGYRIRGGVVEEPRTEFVSCFVLFLLNNL